MRRRDFLKATGAASIPLVLNNVPVFAAPSTGNQLLDFAVQGNQECGKVLVIIQQNGGNDGLNLVIPRDKYTNLYNSRSNILLPEANILPLNGTATTGLHPSLSELKGLYDNGKLTIVQAVSYPNPNFSHFRATDIWFSASSSNQYLDTGWLGRELDITYSGYPQNYPNTTAPDPLAIQIGSTLPFSLQGPSVNMGYNVTDPNALLNVINATTDPAPNNDYGRELTFVRLMKDQSNVYRQRIQDAYNFTQDNSTVYPSNNTLANQLRIVAKLIGGGLKTPVYIVNHPASHDTHVDQVNADKLTGWQPNNFILLSQAIAAFQADITLKGKANFVTGMTFSEFGRRIKSNDSGGTDHGTAAPVLFFGAGVQGGIIGTSPNLPLNATVNDQVPMQYDFRQLYATVMQDWLCLTQTESQTVLGSEFTKLPIFKSTPLALEGVTLTGQYYQGQSRLTCRSLQNQKYKWYALEFSVDGVRFDEVSRKINSGSNLEETYQYTHVTSASKMFYRIVAKDLQGRVDHSNIVVLRASEKQQVIRVFPNPIPNFKIHVQFLEPVSGAVDVTIYDILGAKHYYNRFNGVQTSLNFIVPPSFNKQTHYILEVSYGDTKTREQIVFR